MPCSGSHSKITVFPITFFVHTPTGFRRVCSGHQNPESAAACSWHVVLAVYTKLTVNSKHPSTYFSCLAQYVSHSSLVVGSENINVQMIMFYMPELSFDSIVDMDWYIHMIFIQIINIHTWFYGLRFLFNSLSMHFVMVAVWCIIARLVTIIVSVWIIAPSCSAIGAIWRIGISPVIRQRMSKGYKANKYCK